MAQPGGGTRQARGTALDTRWSGLQFSSITRSTRYRSGPHWLAAGASVAVHALLLGGVLVLGGQGVVSGNAAVAEQRVQLRFVVPAAAVSEVGASSAAAQPAAALPPQASPAAQPVDAPPVTPATALAATTSALPMPMPMPEPEPASASVASPALAALPARSASTDAAGQQTPGAQAGRGHGHHGHGQHADNAAPQLLSAGEMDWAQAVMRRLERFRSYPAAARALRIEGVVVVQATIAEDGKVLGTRLRRSCGNPDLDAEALATFSRARRLPAPPAYLPSPLQVDLPVAFSLRS